MAIAPTWQYKVTVTDVAAKVFSVSATRTDGEDVWGPSGLSGLSYATSPTRTLADIRNDIVTFMYGEYQKAVALTVATTAIANQEALLATATEALES